MPRKPKPLSASAFLLLKALAKNRALPITLDNIVEGGELARRQFATLLTADGKNLTITDEGRQHLKENNK